MFHEDDDQPRNVIGEDDLSNKFERLRSKPGFDFFSINELENLVPELGVRKLLNGYYNNLDYTFPEDEQSMFILTTLLPSMTYLNLQRQKNKV